MSDTTTTAPFSRIHWDALLESGNTDAYEAYTFLHWEITDTLLDEQWRLLIDKYQDRLAEAVQRFC